MKAEDHNKGENDRIFSLMRDRFAAVEEDCAGINEKIDKLYENLDSKMTNVDNKFDRLVDLYSEVSKQLATHDTKLQGIEQTARKHSAYISMVVSAIMGGAVSWFKSFLEGK